MEKNLDISQIVKKLQPPLQGNLTSIVLDTDTYNEVDDQFAIAYALKSSEINVQAIYAAPFHNSRCNDPSDGMELSYQEIFKLLMLMNRNDLQNDQFVKKGSTRYIDGNLEKSAAVEDLVQKALAARPNQPLYIVAIGAITNIANAILLEPKIIENIVVIWLGGNALEYKNVFEFNLMQDTRAARIVLDAKVPLVLLPCLGVVDSLTTTIHELKACIGGANPLCDYLVEIVAKYHHDHFAWSKVIWDIATIAWLKGIGCEASLRPCPILNGDLNWSKNCWQKIWNPEVNEYDFPVLRWSIDPARHLIQYVYAVHRDAIFYDLFRQLQS